MNIKIFIIKELKNLHIRKFGVVKKMCEVKILEHHILFPYAHCEYMRKVSHYKKEWHGDRIRIMTYELDVNEKGVKTVKRNYMQFSDREVEILYDLMRNNSYSKGER